MNPESGAPAVSDQEQLIELVWRYRDELVRVHYLLSKILELRDDLKAEMLEVPESLRYSQQD